MQGVLALLVVLVGIAGAADCESQTEVEVGLWQTRVCSRVLRKALEGRSRGGSAGLMSG